MMKMSENKTISDQIADIRNLQPGWYDGEQGKAYSKESLDWLELQFQSFYPKDLPEPYIFPEPDGEVLCEWEKGVWFIAVHFNFSDLSVRIFIYEGTDDDEFERTYIEQQHHEFWTDLNQTVRNMESAQ
jgi:hypothetical protein